VLPGHENSFPLPARTYPERPKISNHHKKKRAYAAAGKAAAGKVIELYQGNGGAIVENAREAGVY
jgi:hypothetical protein